METRMEALEAIQTRRSIRSFTDAPIEDAALQQMLEAAMAAPSAGNAQPWRFVVIRDKTLLQRITAIHPYAAMAANAALAILVCADITAEKFCGFWPQDCSAATQNLMLAARALDIGTVWCGIHPVEEREKAFQTLFNLPETVRPFALVAAGYTSQPFTRRDTYDRNKIHQNTW